MIKQNKVKKLGRERIAALINAIWQLMISEMQATPQGKFMDLGCGIIERKQNEIVYQPSLENNFAYKKFDYQTLSRRCEIEIEHLKIAPSDKVL